MSTAALKDNPCFLKLADKAIGELEHASSINDSDLLPMEQGGEAKYITGEQLTEFIDRNIVRIETETLPVGSDVTGRFDPVTGTLYLGIPRSLGAVNSVMGHEPDNTGNISDLTAGDIGAVGFIAAIAAGTNYNEITTPGTYYCSAAVASGGTLSNNPYTAAHWLIVFCGDTTPSRVLQIATMTNPTTSGGNTLRYRSFNIVDSRYGAWRNLITDSDVIALTNGGTGASTAEAAAVNLGLAYAAGTYSISAGGAYGFITGSGKAATIYVPLPKSLAYRSSVTINSLTAQLRHASGGYVGSNGVDMMNYTVSASLNGQSLYITVVNDSGWGFTNNTPFVGAVTCSFTLT